MQGKKVQDESRPEDVFNHSIFAGFEYADDVLKGLLHFEV